ncbi:nucleoside deaminase [Falsiroseomonas tokyonensis]|uniref:Nucleoside deaminase n=1 Tax=Falsiroseomonas tokyonensis TaxID=430521 RepID=A0ABV7C1V7_9PROT|nr:nucleoside deaminase [Falsiroseomonas tokyonensis]MBU8540106.1 nucleoside deaminase [Falsiroseomonas tokyonensis]
MDDAGFMALALAQAQTGFEEGGVPVGAVLVGVEGRLLGAGRNRRVQQNDPIAHGEMDCLRRVGRLRSYAGTTLYTTLTPCMMCTGTILQFGIPRVVIGENRSFAGNEGFLRERGVKVTVLDDPACAALMQRFQRERPEVWAEDIGEVPETPPTGQS